MSLVTTAPPPGTAATTPSPQPADPRSWTASRAASQIRILTARSLRSILSDPRKVLLTLLMPLIMLVLFSQVFGSLVATSSFPAGVSYIDYLVPAILVNTAMQSALQSGVGLTEDLTNGVLARLRSLPIRMGSVLVARSLSDLARGLVQLLVMVTLAALLFGFSPTGGLLGVAGAIGLALIVGWGLSWVFLALATWLRNAEMMQSVGFLAMFPLMFASSAFVPVAGLPSWLQVVANLNPMTYAVDAARHLALGSALGSGAFVAIGISLVLAVAAGAAAAKGIRRP